MKDENHGRILLLNGTPIWEKGMEGLLADLGIKWEAVDCAGIGNWTQKSTKDTALIIAAIHSVQDTGILQTIRVRHPRIPVLAVLTILQVPMVSHVFEHGVTSCVDHTLSTDLLKLAIDKTLHGQRYISSGAADALAQAIQKTDGPVLYLSLSPREMEVFKAIARGASSKETSHAMQISAKTVSTLRQRVLAKLRLKTNADIVKYAVENGVTS